MANGEVVITWTEQIQPGEKTYISPLTEDQANAALDAYVPGAVASALANDQSVKAAAAGAVSTALGSGGVKPQNIADKAVSVNKASFATTGKNLLDPMAITSGQQIASTGALAAGSLYFVTEYIPVKAGLPYTLSAAFGTQTGPRNFAWYDTSRVLSSFVNNSANTVITANAPVDGYLRATYQLTSQPTAQIEQAAAATIFEPFKMLLPTVQLQQTNIAAGMVGRQGLAAAAVSAEKTSFFAVGKNLYDPTRSISGYYVSELTGTLVALAGFVTSDWIPVTPGQAYTFTPSRKIAWFDPNFLFLSGSDYSATEASAHTATAPAGAAWVRLSYRNSATAQVEAGSVSTAWEPYKITANALTLTQGQIDQITGGGAPISVTRTGTAVQIGTTLSDGSAMVSTADLAGSANGTFNLGTTSRNGTVIHTNTDDVAPIRTTTATIGANHGWSCIGRYTVTGHTKTAADLGSVWTDGSRQYVLLAISGADLIVGGSYTTNADGTTVAAAVAPVAQLTHVSGATHTDAIPITTPVASPQLYPSVKDVSVRAYVDGVELAAGSRFGSTLEVRESYTILDYAALYDWAKANIGQSFSANLAAIAGLVQISNVYQFTGAARCLLSGTVTVLKKVALGECGFVQSVALTPAAGQTVTRYLPGVKAKSGIDFSQPVDLTSYATEISYAPADWADPAKPPIRCVDWLNAAGAKVVGFAFGYLPKMDAADGPRSTLANGWDVRETKKSYPTAVGPVVLNAGDVRSVESYRVYMPPPAAGLSAADTVADGEATWLHADRHTDGTTAAAAPKPGAFVTAARAQGVTLADSYVTAAGVRVSGIGSITAKL